MVLIRPLRYNIDMAETVDEKIEIPTDEKPIPKEIQSDANAHKSRMRRTLERQSKRNVFLMGLGLVLIIIVLIIYGQSLIINFSLLMGKTKKQPSEQTATDAITYIAPPVINPVSSATNSASAIFTGQITNADQVKLYINDELVDVAKPKNNSFVFGDVELQEGTNKITAFAWIKDKKSEQSNMVTVNYLKNPPEVSIDQPNDGDSFHGSSTLTVKGKTDPENTVTVNGTLVITKDNGSFSSDIVLNSGENKIHIEVTDKAGNKNTKDMTVTYSS
jgi:hypothetical protein